MRSLLSGHGAKRISRIVDLLLVTLRRHSLTDISDAAILVNFMVLRRAYLQEAASSGGGGYWPGTGVEATAAELEDLAHYAKFATAVYGSIALAYVSPRGQGYLRGILAHIGRLRRGNLVAIERHCGIPSEHLYHYQEGGRGAFQPTWLLAWDQETQAAVLSIRGTASYEEALTDCVSEAVSCEVGMAHSGFLAAADVLREQVRDPLEKLVSERGARHLVVCGHSMGAACAVLLALSLHQDQRSGQAHFIEGVKIRCLTFGCPPTVAVGPDSAKSMPDILNVVHRLDWVPRARLGNVLRLLEAIGKIESLGLSLRQKLAFAAGRTATSPTGSVRFADVYPSPTAGSVGGRKACAELRLVGRCLWLYDACAGLHMRAEVADPGRLSDPPPLLDDPVRAALDHSPIEYERALLRARCCAKLPPAHPPSRGPGLEP